MSGLYDEDGIDGPFERRMARAMREDRMPSSASIRKSDAALALTAKGLCPSCEKPVNEDGGCTPCKEAGA